MLNYSVNTENVRIFNRNLLKSIDELYIVINKITFECHLFDINNKYIWFSINNIGLIQPTTSNLEYVLYADNKIIDNGLIKIN
jgi:hypothetical protein